MSEPRSGSPPLLLDVSRTLWRASTGRLPTGIDRVCLAYIAHYRDRAQAMIQRGGFRRILSQPASAALLDLLLSPPANIRGALARFALHRAGELAGTPDVSGALYLNVGHTGLDQPKVRDWVARSGVRPVYMVHDLIPLTHPEYCRPGEAERHARRMATVVDTGSGVIANSAATLETLQRWAADRGTPCPPSLVAWLGTEALPAAADLTPPLAGPYFVVLGTIEGRKNHLLLLQLWRDLAQRLGPATPKLVIIGQRGWEIEAVSALLERSAALQGHVIELARCDDATLARYLAHARALLFPSFAEGYGMPLTEALAAGLPIIASDLAVFRELAGDIPRYCDPLDAPAWREAITALAGTDRSPVTTSDYRAPQWVDHFARVDAWLPTLQ